MRGRPYDPSPSRDLLYPLTEQGVGHGASRGRTARPGIVATPGDAKYAAHHRDWVDGLVCSYELEDSGVSEPLSRANQAAAINISFSWRRILFSRRSRFSSSASLLLRPSE